MAQTVTKSKCYCVNFSFHLQSHINFIILWFVKRVISKVIKRRKGRTTFLDEGFAGSEVSGGRKRERSPM